MKTTQEENSIHYNILGIKKDITSIKIDIAKIQAGMEWIKLFMAIGLTGMIAGLLKLFIS